jgi:hypothetical protein
MTTDDSAPAALSPTAPADELRELEVRLAQLEAVVLAHVERFAELDAAARQRGRRALWIRLVLLVLALLAFFALRTFGAGSGS